MKRRRWTTIAIAGGAVVLLSALIVYHFVFTVRPSRGWSFTVFPGSFKKVDQLVFGPDDSLYATLGSRGTGCVIRIHSGKVETLLAGLNRPNGLYFRGDYLYVTEEDPGGRVIRFDLKSRETKVFGTFNRPEGIYVAPDESIFVVEDYQPARFLRIDRSGAIEILNDQLGYGEGLAIDKEGNMYMSETKKGRVLKVKDGRQAVLIDHLREPDQILVAPDGSVWITEDMFLGRVLRYRNGTVEVIARGLRFPQDMAFDVRGRLHVAERGRNRILVFQHL